MVGYRGIMLGYRGIMVGDRGGGCSAAECARAEVRSHGPRSRAANGASTHLADDQLKHENSERP